MDTSSPTSTTLYVSVALCLGIAAAAFAFFSGKAEPISPVTIDSFQFDPIQLDRSRLKAERAERESAFEPGDGTDAIEKLQAGVMKANVLSFENVNPDTVRQVEIEIEFAADEAASAAGGYEHFVEFGAPLFHACQNEVEQVLEAIAADRVAFETMTQDPPEEFDGYRKSCGNVLPELKRSGLVDTSGRWTNAELGPVLLDIFYRYRFGSIIALRTPALQQLLPYERELFWRWQIETEHFNMKARLSAARKGIAARTDSETYPTPLELAKLYVQVDEFQLAQESLQPWCDKNPTERQLQRYCSFIDKHQSDHDS